MKTKIYPCNNRFMIKVKKSWYKKYQFLGNPETKKPLTYLHKSMAESVKSKLTPESFSEGGKYILI